MSNVVATAVFQVSVKILGNHGDESRPPLEGIRKAVEDKLNSLGLSLLETVVTQANVQCFRHRYDRHHFPPGVRIRYVDWHLRQLWMWVRPEGDDYRWSAYLKINDLVVLRQIMAIEQPDCLTFCQQAEEILGDVARETSRIDQIKRAEINSSTSRPTKSIVTNDMKRAYRASTSKDFIRVLAVETISRGVMDGDGLAVEELWRIVLENSQVLREYFGNIGDDLRTIQLANYVAMGYFVPVNGGQSFRGTLQLLDLKEDFEDRARQDKILALRRGIETQGRLKAAHLRDIQRLRDRLAELDGLVAEADRRIGQQQQELSEIEGN